MVATLGHPPRSENLSQPLIAERSRPGIESGPSNERITCRFFGSSSSSLLCWPSLATLVGDVSLGSLTPPSRFVSLGVSLIPPLPSRWLSLPFSGGGYRRVCWFKKQSWRKERSRRAARREQLRARLVELELLSSRGVPDLKVSKTRVQPEIRGFGTSSRSRPDPPADKPCGCVGSHLVAAQTKPRLLERRGDQRVVAPGGKIPERVSRVPD